ncbi:competence/damage-inducible protein CinA [Bacteroidetes bacterium oral taxon 272 str. F0290]|uniref:CinA family protein n=1 Tax=Phocaeicola abscessus TaxID=555313 RepID=UPI000386A0F9|nr:CinA family protein [Phocaeicola abscessus]EPT33688.1 competence/damage-inducible protein CinA [Bacteroidetes bacterium oral taxon 272 str. F0290]
MSLESKFLSREINDLFWREELTLSTAESCTGGLLASSITAIPGSSQFYKGGVIAYSLEAKEQLLGVSRETLQTKGVVSKETVVEMAKGAMKSMNSDCAIATTGIAGPTGGTSENPVGTIWIAAVCRDRVITEKLEGDNGRELNVLYATEKALQLLIKLFPNEEKENEK